MSKKPPAFTWQDKAILIMMPIIVLVVFIMANYFTQDTTVSKAFEQEKKEIEVRDGGTITQVYPMLATDSVSCRVEAQDTGHNFDFIFVKNASDTLSFEIGRKIQFYGLYEHSKEGGKVTAPYKGKSGKLSGWAIYNNKRYAPTTEFDENTL